MSIVIPYAIRQGHPTGLTILSVGSRVNPLSDASVSISRWTPLTCLSVLFI